MKRWISGLVLGTMLAACQTQSVTPTGAVEQELASCLPGNNYPNATMPTIGQWTGTIPTASAGQVFVTYPDPDHKGFHLVFLADPKAGAIVWVIRVKDADRWQVGAAITKGSNEMADISHPPPPPPGVCCHTPPELASVTLEMANVFVGLPETGALLYQ